MCIRTGEKRLPDVQRRLKKTVLSVQRRRETPRPPHPRLQKMARHHLMRRRRVLVAPWARARLGSGPRACGSPALKEKRCARTCVCVRHGDPQVVAVSSSACPIRVALGSADGNLKTFLWRCCLFPPLPATPPPVVFSSSICSSLSISFTSSPSSCSSTSCFSSNVVRHLLLLLFVFLLLPLPLLLILLPLRVLPVLLFPLLLPLPLLPSVLLSTRLLRLLLLPLRPHS